MPGTQPMVFKTPRRKAWLRANHIAWAILLIGLAAPAALMLRRNLSALGLHHDVIYPEAADVQLALWTAQTGRVFPPLQRPPFTPAIYGPLFYLALAALARPFHFSLHALLLAGRLGSLAAYLGLGCVVYLFNRRRGYGWPACLAAALALGASPGFSAWIICARPDLGALFFSLLGLWLAQRGAQAGGVPPESYWIWAGAACSTAWLLKQSYAAAPLAVLAWLVFTRRRKASLLFLAACALPALLVLGTLWLRGEPVLVSLLRLRYALMQPRIGLSILIDQLRLPGNLLLLGLGGLGWLRAGRPVMPARRGQAWTLAAIYFPLAWTLPVWPILQSGGGGNYLFEAWTACALWLPEGLRALAAWSEPIEKRLKTSPLALSRALAGAGIGLLIAAMAGLFGARLLQPSYIVRQRSYGNLKLLRPLRIFSSDDYLTVHGRQPELLDPDLAHILSLTGHFSDAPIRARLRRRRYDLLLLGNWWGALPAYRGVSYYSRAEIQSINRYYRPLCATRGLTAWIPKTLPPKSSPLPLHPAQLSHTLRLHCRPREFVLLTSGRYQFSALPAKR